MAQQRTVRRSPALRPRAGGTATALFLAGLALSASVAMFGSTFVEPASAHSAVGRIDQPSLGMASSALNR